MSDDSLLDGAAELGPAGVKSTLEQFAARWNAQSREVRAAWLDDRREDSYRAMNCWLMQHEQLADQARFHRERWERWERITIALSEADPELYERIMEQFG